MITLPTPAAGSESGEMDPQMLSKDEMLELVKEPLTTLVQSDIDEDLDPEKIQTYINARIGNLYWKGKHYNSLTLKGNQLSFTAIGTPNSTNTPLDDDGGLYDTVINHYHGFGKKFVAVVGNKPPNCKAVADNPEDQESEKNSRVADVAIRVLGSWWDEERLNRRMVKGMWNTNTQFGHVRYVADAERFGTTEVPQFSLVDQEMAPAGYECPQCGARVPQPDMEAPQGAPMGRAPSPAPDGSGSGVSGLDDLPGLGPSLPPPGSGAPDLPNMGEPGGGVIPCPGCGALLGPETFKPAVTTQVPQQTGSKSYPNGRIDLSIYDVLSVTVPTEATSLDDCMWLRLEKEEHRGKLIAKFPKLADKIRKSDAGSGTGSTSASQSTGLTARTERDSIHSNSYPRKNLITTSYYWVLPGMYQLIVDEPLRKAIEKVYPTGLRITRVLDEIVDLTEEKLRDVWDYCQPDTSDTILAAPIGQDFIAIQDSYNDSTNIGIETFTRGLPTSIADSSVVDFEKLRSKSFKPNEMIPSRPNMGKNMKDAIASLPKAEMSDQMVPFNQKLLDDGMTITGMLPSVYGGEGVSQTAHEAEMKRNQALQQLNIPWDEIRQFWARIKMKGVKQLARFGAKMEIAPGDAKKGFGADVLDVSELSEDGWHVEAEESFPMTWGQRRDQINMAMQSPNPMAMQVLGMLSPQNAANIQELLGFPGWFIPGYDLLMYVQKRIRELLQSPPMQQFDPMTGQPITLPSIQPDPFVENNHQVIAEIIRGWCTSPAGLKAAEKNQPGYQNVVAYGGIHEQLLAAAMAPPPSEDGGDSGEGGPPKEGGGGAPNSSPGIPQGGGPPAASAPGVSGPGGSGGPPPGAPQ